MITPIVSSFIYSTNRRTVLEVIPPWLRTTWKQWDLRLAVLISLFIHILLSILGNRRKYSRKLWIRISVWSAYTAAEPVTIFALGIISNNLSDLSKDKGHGTGGAHLDPNIELTTVWAQFLFLHLGGPDAITAYALEDNELWLRQLFGLVCQTCSAIYLILLTWTDQGSRFSILSILMFVVGFIKYGERTWVLRAASYQNHRKSVRVDHFKPHTKDEKDMVRPDMVKPEYNIKSKEGYSMKIAKCPDVPVSIDFSGIGNESISDEKKFLIVNEFFSITNHLFVDAPINSSYKDTIRTVFKNISLEDALQVIEIQIGMIFDLRYTKAPLLHSCTGLWLRFFTFFLTCCSLVFFSCFDGKHKYSKVDVSITFLLLAVAVGVEIYAVLMLAFSDRFSLWLIKRNKTSLFRILNGFPLLKSPRWCNTMSQYTLLSFTKKTKHLPSCRGFPKIGIWEYHEWNTQVTGDLQDMIFQFFKEKSEELTTTGKDPFTALPVPTNSNQEQQEEGGKRRWEEFEYMIIIWSIATEVLYYIDRKEQKNPKWRAIKRISRYMLYLLVKNPSMISAETDLMVVSFEDITKESSNPSLTYVTSRAENCKAFLPFFLNINTSTEGQNRLLIHKAMKLVKKLQDTKPNQEERWKSIGRTWMGIMGYAATKSKANEHTKQLRRGGELFTHVWLLMAHFGLTHHFQISSSSNLLCRLVAK